MNSCKCQDFNCQTIKFDILCVYGFSAVEQKCILLWKCFIFCLSLFGLLPAAACLNCCVWSKKIVVNIKAIHKCVPHKNIAIKGKNVRYEQILSLDHRHRHYLHRHRHHHNIFCCILCVFIFSTFLTEIHFHLNFIAFTIGSNASVFEWFFFFLFWMFPSWILMFTLI